ncbi:hypothetical protein [Caulobacter sp. KR2-114]|uniref:hypothetical protein n=1 Tax=Caulobacter sp. KR2-114 TaxID=3400912 RepID=UPI003C2E2E20
MAPGEAWVYLSAMGTYTLKLFRSRPGTAVQMGDGELHFEVGDDATAIRYAQSDLSEAIADHDIVELHSSDGRVLWERRPNA